MAKTEYFLSKEDEQEIIEAIRIAEESTSGEIRVHIEKTTSIDAYERALEVFHKLKMHETELKNGVLIYLASEDQSFAICGDKGINDAVTVEFWNSIRDVMFDHFKQGNFKQGLVDGVLKVGEQLENYFPWLDDDIDELSNEISKE